MSQTVHLMFANNVGCGMPEVKCHPCSGVCSGRTAAAHSCPSLGHHRIHPRVRIVCEAKRNSDFSRQNKHGPSRGRKRSNDGRDIFENFEEDMLSSKNGPLVSLSTSGGKFQATSAPGSREKEIVELFRKVQARLRERAAIKEEKKVEAPRGHGKEKSAVDSLLNLLKKHSSEKVKRSSVGDKGKDLNPEANITSITRPRSIFQRRSPVPRLKNQPVSNNERDTNIVSMGSRDNGNSQDQTDLNSEDEPEPESDLETKDELVLPELSEDDSEQTSNDQSVEEQLLVQSEDFSELKLSELRALAKSRGLKGFSKMKKGKILELLAES